MWLDNPAPSLVFHNASVLRNLVCVMVTEIDVKLTIGRAPNLDIRVCLVLQAPGIKMRAGFRKRETDKERFGNFPRANKSVRGISHRGYEEGILSLEVESMLHL